MRCGYRTPDIVLELLVPEYVSERSFGAYGLLDGVWTGAASHRCHEVPSCMLSLSGEVMDQLNMSDYLLCSSSISYKKYFKRLTAVVVREAADMVLEF